MNLTRTAAGPMLTPTASGDQHITLIGPSDIACVQCEKIASIMRFSCARSRAVCRWADRASGRVIGAYESRKWRLRHGPDHFIARVHRAWSRVVCHPAERVSDREIGGVRKITSGTGDVNRTTGSISPAVDVECFDDAWSWVCAGSVVFGSCSWTGTKSSG